MVRIVLVVTAILVLLACKSGSRSKNDDIAACTASGGRWTEGGCNDNGHCEKSSGMAPDFDDDLDDEYDGAEEAEEEEAGP